MNQAHVIKALIAPTLTDLTAVLVNKGSMEMDKFAKVTENYKTSLNASLDLFYDM